MKILNQTCNTLDADQRIIIRTDQDGFNHMKAFLNGISKSLLYADLSSHSIEEVFLMTNINEEYLISCETYIFVNLIHTVLWEHSEKKINDIPSIFYNIFFDKRYAELIELIHEVCGIDPCILKGYLDTNKYELIFDVDWTKYSIETVNKHYFIDAKLVSSLAASEFLGNLFSKIEFYNANEIKNGFICPISLSVESKEYNAWKKLMEDILKTQKKLIDAGFSYETVSMVLPKCAASEIYIIASLEQWKDFFNEVIRLRIISGNENKRELIKIMASYLIKYIEFDHEFKNKLIKLIESINEEDELPF